MTLKTRIIPIVLYRGAEAFKGKQFKSWRSTGSVVSAVKVHAHREVDELCILDIGATPNYREPDFQLIADLAGNCFCPLTVGGGIRTLEHFRLALANGADKVAVNTAALEDQDLIRAAAEKFGKQAVVVSIDVAQGKFVAVNAGQRAYIRRDPVMFAREVENLGAGEILLNSVERDGMMCGYDLDMIARVAAAVSIPVIACGGAGSYEDFHEALKHGAHAVAAGALFDFTDATPSGAALFLAERGVPVRLDAVPAEMRAKRSI